MGQWIQGHISVGWDELSLFGRDAGADEVENNVGHGTGQPLCSSKLSVAETVKVSG